ncbi:tRNA (guanine-N(7)-)-methyltransferase [Trifolium repens]|nr:tRNA (guanine-N(7)-)-methyltransferase [Trifolium repens]
MSCCCGWRMLQLQVQSLSALMLPQSLSPFRPLSSSSFSQAVVAEQQEKPQQLRSSQLVSLEYTDLNLSYDLNLGHGRIRQHVNPFSPSFSTPAQVPDWSQVFADPALPLMVDIGCGSGRFLMWLAKRTPKVRNYLGLEIRRKMVKRAEVWVKDLALDNIHFLFANAPISFKQLVESYPGPLQLVSVLCPDPHFKKKHHKRRVLQKPLVGAIVDHLTPGGQVFVQSDVLEVALDMKDQLDEVDALSHIDALNRDILCDSEGWLLSNPMGIRTEREIHAEFEGAKIYRRLYEKKQM